MNKNNIWNFSEINQEHNSSITSVNASTMPKTVKYIEDMIEPGTKWADIGGGRFDNVVDFFKSKGAILHIYDPFNRTFEHNLNAVGCIKGGQCDGVMVNNVLNVIDSSDERKRVILQAFDAIKEGGLVFFKIYEGNKSAIKSLNQRKDNSSVQLNLRASEYLPEIQSVFGTSAHRVGDIIIAKRVPEKKLNYIDLDSKLKSLGIGQRSKSLGVGKVMGDEVYIHKDYCNLLNKSLYDAALKILKENTVDFKFDVIKFNEKTKKVSFIESPDFDDKQEPTVGDIFSVDIAANMVNFIRKKKDPQIYHHKWLFVKDDYKGFDVEESKRRSVYWKSLVGKNKDISSRIGYRSFWEALENNNFSTQFLSKKGSIKTNM